MMFSTAFERFSYDNQTKIRAAVETTAQAVSPGGVVLGALQEMLASLKRIESASGKNGSSVLSFLLGKKTLVGIGESFKLIAEAINSISGTGKEAKEKVEAITLGITNIAEMGGKLLKFAMTLAIGTPLLILSLPFAPIFAATTRMILGALMWAAKPLNDPKTLEALEKLEGIGKSILILGGSMALALPLYLLALPATLLVSAVIGVLGLTFFLLDKLKISKSIEETSRAIKKAGFAILILGASLVATYFLMRLVGGDFYETTLKVLGIIVIVGATFALVGLVSPLIKKGSIALLFAAASIVAITAGLLLFRLVIPPDKSGWITLGQLGTALLGIGTIMAIAGSFFPFIALGAVGFLLAGASLVLLSFGLLLMSNLFKGEGFKKMLAPSGQKTKGFLGIGGGREMSNLEYLLLSVANSFVISPLKIAAMVVSIPVMILAGAAMVSIAYGLKKIQNLNIDPAITAEKVGKIATVLADTFGKIGQKYPGGRKSIFNRLFGGGQQSAVADGIDAVMGMGRAMSSIARGVQAMATLKIPVYEGTEIKRYVSLSNSEINQAGENMTRIVTVLGETFGKLGKKYPGGRKSFFNRLFGGGGEQSAVADGISSVMGMGRFLSQLAQGIKMMAEMKIPQYDKEGNVTGYIDLTNPAVFDKVGDSIGRIISSLSSELGKIGRSPDAKRKWWFGASNIKRGTKAVNLVAESIANMANSILVLTDSRIDENRIGNKLSAMFKAISDPFIDSGTGMAITQHTVNKIDSLAESLKKIDRNIRSWERFVKGFSDYSKNFGTFKDNLNAIEPQRLQMVTQLFTSLSKFDDKSIKNLSEVLSDAIRELRDSIGKGLDKLGAPSTSVVQVQSTTGTTTTSVADVAMLNAIKSLSTNITSLKQTISQQNNTKQQMSQISNLGLDKLDDALLELTAILNKLEQKI